jgi:hypothetical protein
MRGCGRNMVFLIGRASAHDVSWASGDRDPKRDIPRLGTPYMRSRGTAENATVFQPHLSNCVLACASLASATLCRL